MESTALSNAISRIVSAPSPQAFAEFLEVFREATLGVVALTLPSQVQPGETFRAGKGDVSLTVVSTPDGRRMVKACADPPVFAKRYPETKINALMSGEELLGIAARSSDIDGILVCSAASHHSVPISRSDAAQFLAEPAAISKPWWKLWRR